MKGKHAAHHTQNRAGSPKNMVIEEPQIIQLIVFKLGDEEFGADVAQVREIIKTGFITPVPDSPHFINGMTNVRGEIVLAIDLKLRFSLRLNQETESRHVIITREEENPFGLMVDEVTEVLRVPQSDIKPAPGLVTKIERKYISGVLTLDNRLITLLDLTKVLSEAELSSIDLDDQAEEE